MWIVEAVAIAKREQRDSRCLELRSGCKRALEGHQIGIV